MSETWTFWPLDYQLGNGRSGFFVVRAPTWYLARCEAWKHFGHAGVGLWGLTPDRTPDIIVEWAGTAASSPSTLELVEADA